MWAFPTLEKTAPIEHCLEEVEKALDRNICRFAQGEAATHLSDEMNSVGGGVSTSASPGNSILACPPHPALVLKG